MSSARLWNQKAKHSLQEIFRYGRYIINGHFLIFLFFAIGAGAYYYRTWVRTLSADFPLALLFAIVFAFQLSGGSVITFFRPADPVFLMPMERRMKGYIFRSFLFTFFWQSYFTLMVLLLLSPIYFQLTAGGRGFIRLLGFLLLLKGWNLRIRWLADFDPETSTPAKDRLFRFLMSGTAVYLFIEGALFPLALLVLVFLFYGWYWHRETQFHPLPWERLIENEERRRMLFFRLANWFTDVPQWRSPVKRRRWLDGLLRLVGGNGGSPFHYLVPRIFFRSGDYLGLYVRLSMIGGVLLFWLGGSLAGAAFAILFQYLTGIQLLSMDARLKQVIWTLIYPVREGTRQDAVLAWIRRCLWLQSLWFGMLLLIRAKPGYAVIVFSLLILSLYLFVEGYGKRQIVPKERG